MPEAGQEKKTQNYLFKNFRFISAEHQAMVREAAELAGLSVNAWIVSVTLQAARKQLSR